MIMIRRWWRYRKQRVSVSLAVFRDDTRPAARIIGLEVKNG
jgi:hypothetical protein